MHYSFVRKKTIIHEIGHLMGLQDRYDDETDASGNRSSSPHEDWKNNIMGNPYGGGIVGYRNFEEALQMRNINSITRINR